VEKALDAYVRPMLRRDGGDVELLDIKDTVVYCRLVGACAGCGGAGMTMKLMVERTLKEMVDDRVRISACKGCRMRTIYLDNNATTAVAPEVRAAMEPISTGVFNPSSAYDRASSAAQAIKRARAAVARFLGASTPPRSSSPPAPRRV